ncbi:MAG: hypothetical protein FWH23_02445 [Bacteroidales bacterium]|nr:hypothetical protein [Bacteroidales bacterium]
MGFKADLNFPSASRISASITGKLLSLKVPFIAPFTAIAPEVLSKAAAGNTADIFVSTSAIAGVFKLKSVLISIAPVMLFHCS